MVQVHVPARVWGFESLLRHQLINRQKELATSAATAPLQQQITDLNKLVTDQQDQIKKLQEQMQADADAALAAKSTAHRHGLWQGLGIGSGVVLLLFIVAFVVRRLSKSSAITKKSQATGASA